VRTKGGEKGRTKREGALRREQRTKGNKGRRATKDKGGQRESSQKRTKGEFSPSFLS